MGIMAGFIRLGIGFMSVTRLLAKSIGTMGADYIQGK